MKDIDLINEAYGKVRQLDEAVPLAGLAAPLLGGGAKAAAGTTAKTLGSAALQAGVTAGAERVGQNLADKVTNEDSLDDDNNTSLEPGEKITGIKKQAILDVIMQGLDELVKGNTGPDSPCSERDALDLIVSSCNQKLHEMGDPVGGY